MHWRISAAFLLLFSSLSISCSEIEDIEDLTRQGVSEEVLLAYVKSSDEVYHLSASNVLRLNDIGTPQSVIAAMIAHGNSLENSSKESLGALSNSVDTPEYSYNDDTAVPTDGKALDLSYFYQALAPYGSWIQDGGQHWWRPGLLDHTPDWRPYFHGGRWVWTDQGWTWSSDYSWGWSCFHYGRWRRHQDHGWLWLPDVTWGPAWVSWRESDSHYGWAPLPPSAGFESGIGIHIGGKKFSIDLDLGLGHRDYTFVPCNRIAEPILYNFGVSRVESRTVFERTRYIENTVSYRNERIWCGGPEITRVRRETRTEFREVRISDTYYRPGDTLRGNRIRDDGFHVYRPILKKEISRSAEDVVREREKRIEEIKTRRLLRDERTANIEDAQKNQAERREQRLQLARQHAEQVREARTESVVNHNAAIQARREAVLKTQEARRDAQQAAIEQRQEVQRATQQHHQERAAQLQQAAVAHRAEAQASLAKLQEADDAKRLKYQKAIETHRAEVSSARQQRNQELQAHHESQAKQHQAQLELQKQQQKARAEAIRTHHDDLAKQHEANAKQHARSTRKH